MENLITCIKNSDSKLRTLFKTYNTENSLPLEVFYDTLRKYNLKDALQVITILSQMVYRENPTYHNFRPFGLMCKNGEILTTMSMLADLTYHFILSGANDRNNSKISNKAFYNGITLSRLCHYHLNNKKLNQENFNIYNLLQILAKEQGQMQLPIIPALARNYIMFNNIAKSDDLYKKRPNLSKDIFTDFEKFLTITYEEYFQITFLIFAFVLYDQRTILDPKVLSSLDVKNNIFSFDKISHILEYLSASYSDYKGLANSHLDLNPLYKKPIIKFDDIRFGKYTCPNLSIFLEKCWNGLFYDIEDYYKKNNPSGTIRDTFGYVFEEYIGVLIKETLPNITIYPEIVYTKGKRQFHFVDWIIEIKRNDLKEFYLIEVKSSEVPNRYCYNEQLHNYYKEDVIRKINKGINKLSDIDTVEELAFLKGEKVYPIFIFKDLPFINSTVINDLLISCSENYPELCTRIKNNELYIFNVDSFENFIKMLKDNTFSIEWLFNEQKNNSGENLNTIMQKKYGKMLLRNSYIEKTFNEIFKDLIPNDYNE